MEDIIENLTERFTGIGNHMDENHQDKTESKAPATQAKVSVSSEKKVGVPKHNGTRKQGNQLAGFFKTWATPLSILLAALTLGTSMYQFNAQRLYDTQRAEFQFNADQRRALDQQRATILQTYIDNIQDLLLNHNLLQTKPGDHVALLARVRTLAALQGLDPQRKGVLVQFIYKANLIGYSDQFLQIIHHPNIHPPIVILFGADLTVADLDGAPLSGADLIETNLSNAHLAGADLKGAELGEAQLESADLSGAYLSRTDITQQQLDQVKSCQGAILPNGLTCPEPKLPQSTSFSVYTDASDPENHYIPSDFMGDFKDITLNENWTANPHSGRACIRNVYSGIATPGYGWAGVYWQNPENNGGTVPGYTGYDLSHFSHLSFWVRGELGGEQIQFLVGGITGPYPNSLQPAVMTPMITLTTDWQVITISFRRRKPYSHHRWLWLGS